MKTVLMLQLLLVILVTGVVNGQSWHTEMIDSESNAGRRSAIAIDSNDNIHISYTRETYGYLKYALFDGTSWNIEILRDNSAHSYNSIAVEDPVPPDSVGLPHIAYYYSGRGVDYLAYYSFDGSDWHHEWLDGYYAGMYVDIALDDDKYPHISYFSAGAAMNVKYTYFDGSSWIESIADTSYFTGEFSSIALEAAPGNYPHISYHDGNGNNLKYSRWNGSSWDVELIDYTGNVGNFSSIALDSNDYPHIVYCDNTNDYLKYARWNGSSWQVSVVDSNGSSVGGSSIAIDSSDGVHISYVSSVSLKYAYWNGSSWEIDTIDGSNTSAFTSIALDSNDRPHISYSAGSYDGLKHAYYGTLGIEDDSPTDGLISVLDVFPNPSFGDVEVWFLLAEGMPVDMQVFDVYGRLVHSTTADLEPGENSLVLDRLEQGVHFLRISAGGSSESHRFVILD